MAIAFVQQPAANSIQASDNPINFVFSGSNYLEANFSFIVETYINGVLVSTDMVFPERVDRAHIDIKKTTLPYFSAARRIIETPASLFLKETLSTAYIKVAERYGDTPVTYAFTSSNTFKVMKACCDDEEYSSTWIETNYAPEVKWLTDVPFNTYLATRSATQWFSILNNAEDITVVTKLYDEDGATLYTDTQNTTGKDRINFRVNETSLDSILTAASLTLDDVGAIGIKLNDSEEIKILYVGTDCDLNQQVSWLNKLGAYDQMIFSHNREIQYEIKEHSYKKQFGAWIDGNMYVSAAENTFQFDKLSSGDTAYLKVIQPVGSLYTGWISEEYQNWLRTLVESVDVMLHVDDDMERILITDTATEELQIKHEEVLSYQVNYKKTNFKSVTQ